MALHRAALAALCVLALPACTPALDWREARPSGGDLKMLFPCRPDRVERAVVVAGLAVTMQMHACSAAGATYSLAFLDAPGPDRVAPLLEALRTLAAENIAGVAEPQPFRPPGATSNPRDGRLRVAGRLPDGRPVIEHAAFFVKGVRIYQATVIGAKPQADAVDTFFGAIGVVP